MEFVMPEIHWAIIVITCCFIVFDIVTGFTQAVVNKELDSGTMKQGLFHKCGFLLAIVFGCLCEYAMQYIDLGFSIPIQNAVCIYIIATEILSILENLGKISPALADARFMNLFKGKDSE